MCVLSYSSKDRSEIFHGKFTDSGKNYQFALISVCSKSKKIYHKLENRSYVVENSQKSSDLGMEKEF